MGPSVSLDADQQTMATLLAAILYSLPLLVYLKMKGAHVRKMRFCNVFARSKFVKTHALNQMHFGSIHWVIYVFFIASHIHDFDPKT